MAVTSVSETGVLLGAPEVASFKAANAGKPSEKSHTRPRQNPVILGGAHVCQECSGYTLRRSRSEKSQVSGGIGAVARTFSPRLVWITGPTTPGRHLRTSDRARVRTPSTVDTTTLLSSTSTWARTGCRQRATTATARSKEPIRAPRDQDQVMTSTQRNRAAKQ